MTEHVENLVSLSLCFLSVGNFVLPVHVTLKGGKLVCIEASDIFLFFSNGCTEGKVLS